jgi:hypothetical protein
MRNDCQVQVLPHCVHDVGLELNKTNRSGQGGTERNAGDMDELWIDNDDCII